MDTIEAIALWFSIRCSKKDWLGYFKARAQGMALGRGLNLNTSIRLYYGIYYGYCLYYHSMVLYLVFQCDAFCTV